MNYLENIQIQIKTMSPEQLELLYHLIIDIKKQIK